MRSLIYGGKAAEVVHMLNDSAIVARLQGEYFSVWILYLFFTEKFSPAMRYVPVGGFESMTKLCLWDGAGSRAQLGGNVGLATPADRYQDAKILLHRFLLTNLTGIDRK
jgi:hypothetical protein